MTIPFHSMLRALLVVLLFGAFVVPGFVRPPGVSACSATEWDRVVESDVIIAGRVVDMRLADVTVAAGRVTTLDAVPGPGEFVPVWVDFHVDRYLKGSGPVDLTVLDARSVVFYEERASEERARFEGASFQGSGGSCGALDADPRGTYWVTGLSVEDGVHSLNLLLRFAAPGGGPEDPSIVDALDRLEARIGPGVTPAATGHGVIESTGDGTSVVLVLIAGVLVVGARFLTIPGAASPPAARDDPM